MDPTVNLNSGHLHGGVAILSNNTKGYKVKPVYSGCSWICGVQVDFENLMWASCYLLLMFTYLAIVMPMLMTVWVNFTPLQLTLVANMANML